MLELNKHSLYYEEKMERKSKIIITSSFICKHQIIKYILKLSDLDRQNKKYKCDPNHVITRQILLYISRQSHTIM